MTKHYRVEFSHDSPEPYIVTAFAPSPELAAERAERQAWALYGGNLGDWFAGKVEEIR